MSSWLQPVTVMLVTMLRWWLPDCNRLKMLMTESFYWCFFNLTNMSPKKLSPIYVTNMTHTELSVFERGKMQRDILNYLILDWLGGHHLAKNDIHSVVHQNTWHLKFFLSKVSHSYCMSHTLWVICWLNSQKCQIFHTKD